MTVTLPAKEFVIWLSEKSYRFKEEAFVNHAPQTPGIYELVTFDAEQNPQVLYAGLVTDRSIFDALNEHFRGEREPAAHKLLAQNPNLYFSFIVESDAKTPEDLQDLFYAVVQQDKPKILPPISVQPTGRYAEISIKDRSIL